MERTRELDRKPPNANEARSDPTRVGRYTIVERVGEGAMGVVYAAYDPKLDRRVALKALHHAEDDRAEATLIAEARAMARLSHANVVAIHDVMTEGDRVFIAMDYVEGGTLRDWVGSSALSWAEKLEGLRAAGRGLAAAHEAEIVHRDFKPDNVLVSASGELRVSDFGLARAVSTENSRRLLKSQRLPTTITGTSGLVGTPLYMAPELFDGRPANAQSDQFAYCVTALEVLHGVQPFADASLIARYEAVSRGELAEVPAVDGLPASIGAALRRGVRPDPARRWPDMRALLGALEPRRGSRANLIFAGAALATASAVAWFATRGDACPTAQALTSELYPSVAQARIAEGLRRSAVPYAEDTTSRVGETLQTYADRWAAMQVEVCTSHAEGFESDSVHERRDACLAARRREFQATLNVLADADAKVAARAASLTRELRKVDRCADMEWLVTEVAPPPPDVAGPVEELRERIASAEAQLKAGAWKENAAVEIVDDASALGYAPVQAAALMIRAQVLDSLERQSEAHGLLFEAYGLAERAGSDAQRLRAASLLVRANAQPRHLRPEQAEPWAKIALSLAQRMGTTSEAVGAHLAVGNLHKHDGRFAEALQHLQQGLELAREVWGEEHPTIARVLNNIGSVYVEQRQTLKALPYFEQATAMLEHLVGDRHPDVASMRYNLGSTYGRLGRSEDARTQIARARDAWLDVFGSEHPRMGVVEFGLAEVEDGAGNYGAALDGYRKAAAIWERDPDANALYLATALNNAASLLLHRGDASAARAMAVRALGLQTQRSADPHGIAETRLLVADTEAAVGNLGAALEQAEAAVAAFEELEDAVGLAIALEARARAHHDLGDPTRTTADFRRAIEVGRAESGEDTPRNARTLWRWAKFELSRDPVRARELIDRASTLLANHPEALGAQERTSLTATRALVLLRQRDPEASAAVTEARELCGGGGAAFVSGCRELEDHRATVAQP